MAAYIPSDPRISRGFLRGFCHVPRSDYESCKILLRIFQSDYKEYGGEEESGLLYFARACCTSKLLRLVCKKKLCKKKSLLCD